MHTFVPSRLDPHYRPKIGYELVPVDCFNTNLTATGIDIILVHGLGSNPDTTWQKLAKDDLHNQADPLSSGKKYVNWVADFLCDDLPPDIRRHTRVFFYNYDSYWKRAAIEERRSRLGLELFEEVTSMAVKTPERSIIFVGHSYGGLVIKEALLKAQFLQSRRPVNIFPQIKAIMFLGTPHRGSASASLGVKAAKLFRAFGLKASPSIVEAITYDSVELQDMHRQFNAISDHVRIINFYEKRETQEFWGLWSDIVVKEQSATLDRPNAGNIGLHTDHSGLNKFAERDSNYKKIRNKLIELMEAIIADVRLGTLVYSVPHKTQQLYTERRSLSESLEGKLNKSLKKSDQIAHAVAIVGLGGTGKTQLALRYVEKHKLRYDTILWIDARNEATIRSSFQRCAQDLKLLVDAYRTIQNLVALRDDPAVRVVLSWLQERNQLHGEWLIILDNADDLNSGVRDVIPSGVRGSIILTSRDIESVEILPLGSQQLWVDIMEPQESISLLLRHLNLGAAEVTEDIRELSLSICENLQHLALAVHLAGAYTRSLCRSWIVPDDSSFESTLGPKCCLERYLQNYKTHRDRLLKDDISQRLSSYNLTVWTVWDTSLDAIDAMSSFPSRRLLTLLAHMDPSKIQDEIFRLAAIGQAKAPKTLTHGLPQWLWDLMSVDENGQWDRFAFDETLKPLRTLGLVRESKVDYPGVTMHSLVQWRAKIDDTREPYQTWNLYYSIFMAIASNQALSEPNNARFWQHMASHLPLPNDLLLLESDAKDLIWERIGRLFLTVRHLQEAEKLFMQVIETRKKALSVEHPNTLISMSSLAVTYMSQGRWKEAEGLLVQVIETQKKVIGVEHPDTLACMNTLAATYLNQGRWKEAEGLLVQVIQTRKKVLGAEHPDTLACMSSLAVTYMSQGRWKEAGGLLVQVVKTQKKVIGAEHPDTLMSLHTIAATYLNQGRWKEAEGLLVQVIETQKKVVGAEHPNTLISMSSLAVTYMSQGRWKEAEGLLVQVVKTQKKVIGAEHPDTLACMNTLAATYLNQGRWKEAEGLLVQVIETRKKVLGVEHPDTLACMNTLAFTVQKLRSMERDRGAGAACDGDTS
ncbi:Kinesin light chain 5 [Fusarium oxysporum f. sp. phaseoli]